MIQLYVGMQTGSCYVTKFHDHPSSAYTDRPSTCLLGAQGCGSNDYSMAPGEIRAFTSKIACALEWKKVLGIALAVNPSEWSYVLNQSQA